MKKHKFTLAKKIWKISLIFAFIFGLVLIWFLYNKQMRAIERNVEVTFVSPHQAIVFWKTANSSLGYVKSGQKKYSRTTNTYQTSSEPSKIHTVLLEEFQLPVFISVYKMRMIIPFMYQKLCTFPMIL
jgi:hypothetical protein